LHRFGCRDVGNVHQYFLGAVHVEYFAAGAPPEAAAHIATERFD
jgi:hypothetical protein